VAGKLGEGMGDAVLSNSEIAARLDRIPTNLGSYGVDPFGFDPQYLKRAVGTGAWLYQRYFRCEAVGLENIPDGRCFLISNHSGQLPFDAVMITMAVLLDRDPPRYVRSMVERFVPQTPFVAKFMARCGQILGSPENCRRLLAADEAILAFPEGVRGLNKTWKHRYQLQRFGQGFLRLALETGTPIVPTVVIGAEEQAPSFYNARALGGMFGFPAFPITPTNPLIPGLGLLPLPSRYRIYFGKPMTFEGSGNEEDEWINDKVDVVKREMTTMIQSGLGARDHVFW